MIVIRIFGGIGNQMFQYAFGRALSIKYKRDLIIDKSYFEEENYPFYLHPYYPYKLGLYHIENKFTSSIISKYAKFIKFKRIYYLTNIFSRLPHINRQVPKYFSQRNFTISKFKNTKIAYLDGYWQKYDLLEEFKTEIRNELCLLPKYIPKTNYLDQIKSTNSVSVHFRRGDYISNPEFASIYTRCSLEYYKNAMALISREIKSPVFYIFSNEIDWVKKNLKVNFPIVFIEKMQNDYEELYLMSQCKHNIIANSSFSWMGAWLNQNENKIVVAPVLWWNDPKRINDIYIPKDWKRLNND